MTVVWYQWNIDDNKTLFMELPRRLEASSLSSTNDGNVAVTNFEKKKKFCPRREAKTEMARGNRRHMQHCSHFCLFLRWFLPFIEVR